MKDVIQILSALRSKGITIAVDDAQPALKLNGQVKSLTAADKARLLDHKEAIIAFLRDLKTKKQSGFGRIAKADGQGGFPMSNAQRRLWIASQLEGGNQAYNMAQAYEISGPLRVEALAFAFRQLVERHESLRTVFRADEGGEVRQFVGAPEAAGFVLNVLDLSAGASPDDRARERVEAAAAAPFDLAAGPLLRAGLYRVAPDRWVLGYVLHHIVCDGWSLHVVIRELFRLYHAHAQGEAAPPAPLPVQYKDYVAWQAQQLAGETLQAHKAYWLAQLAGELPVLELPTDRPRPAVKTYHGGLVERDIPAGLSQALKAFTQAQGTTPFMGLLAAVNVLLYRYTRQPDLIVGTPIAGREHVDLEDQIGFYVNTLALRTQLDGQEGYGVLLERVKQVTFGAFAHQAYPFDELVEALNPKHDPSRNALFDVMVSLENESSAARGTQPGELTIRPCAAGEHRTSKFDLTFNFLETPAGLRLVVEYNSDLFRQGTVTRMAAHLVQLLEVLLARPDEPLATLEFLSEAEIHRQLVDFNGPATAYPRDKTLVDLFEAQAARTPGAVAVTCGPAVLTYDALNRQANRLAHHLRNRAGVTAGDPVGLLVGRSADMVAWVLGILKAGGAYVPIDPLYPRERVLRIIEGSGLRWLITDREVPAGTAVEIIDGTQLADALREEPDANPPAAATPDGLAYVIYTSGSTGTPKGVMVEHRTVVNVAAGWEKAYRLREFPVRLLQTASLSFDVFCGDLCRTLPHGGRLVICPTETLLAYDALYELIRDHRITVWESTPALVVPFLRHAHDRGLDLSGLQLLILGSDALPTSDYAWLLDRYGRQMRILNSYGTTETTIDSSFFEAGAAPDTLLVPIGKPFANNQFYVLDPYGKLLPLGVPGELCIGGEGVSRGYRGDPDLTRRKFADDPFRPGGKLYKTGDAARWLEDGNLAFLGRQDAQVKVRGYRIEPGEVERALLTYPGVDAAAVVAHAGPDGEKELVAYVVSRHRLRVAPLRAHLGGSLPSYMLPARYVPLDALPLNANGKVDRNALPAPEGRSLAGGPDYRAPRTETARRLARLWAGVLGLEAGRIGLDDDFFALGGHSLKATRLASGLHRQFEVKVELPDLFRYTTLEDQAGLLERARKSRFAGIAVAPVAESYALSAAQRRLWVVSQFPAASVSYNMPGAYTFRGQLDEAALEAALLTLVERHESLRTVFRVDAAGEPRQVVLPAEGCGFRLERADLRGQPDAQGHVEAFLGRAFDLGAGPLLRAALYRVAGDGWVFGYVMHHILSDGWSMDLLIRELLQLYGAYRRGEPNPLPPLRIQYKDYAAWQGAQLGEAAFAEHKAYWLERFAGPLPVLELPTDQPRPAVKTYHGGLVERTLPAPLAGQLGAYSQAQGATLFMGLLAGVNALLYRYTRQPDLILGTPIAGREHVDLEDQIGFYVNTLALRTQLDGQEGYGALLERVKQVTFEAYAHQAYPFDALVEALDLKHDLSRSALFDVMVVLQNTEAAPGGPDTQGTGDLAISACPARHRTSKFDLIFNFEETDRGLSLGVEYNSDLFHPAFAEGLAAHLERLLAAAVAQPDRALDALDFLGGAERQRLLEGFNATRVDYPQDRTAIDLFEAQAAKTPDAPALVFGEQTLTYAQLNEAANQLGRYVQQAAGVRPGDAVAVLLDRSAWSVITLIGVLKTGAVYVPIDPTLPAARVAYMLRESGARAVITDQALDPAACPGRVLPLREVAARRADTDPGNPGVDIAPAAASYIIYTSGSTGTPKGVTQTHRMLYNLLLWNVNASGLKHGQQHLLFTSFSFDMSLYEVFYPLLTGGTVHVVPEPLRQDLWQLKDYVLARRITTVSMSYAALKALFTAIPPREFAGHCIEEIISTGEQLYVSGGLREFLAQHPDVVLHNCYGPSETHVVTAVSYRFADGDIPAKASIGTPLHNCVLYVLDPGGQPVPVGVEGEIYIGGRHLALGYHGRPDLTAERFVPDPFRPGERVYRTGDIGKWRADGGLEYIRRKDNQLKINGYRIELGEVETVLRNHPQVEEAVVVAKAGAGEEKELVAYLVGKVPLTAADIRSYAGRQLPRYMVPAHVVQLDAMPLNANGKVDKAALPSPRDAAGPDGRDFVAPRTEAERQLAALWAEVLSVDPARVGARDHFFDLGGNSLKAIRLVSGLHRQFEVKVALQDLFRHPSLEEQAGLLEKAGAHRFVSIPAAAPGPDYVLSAAQRRLWVLGQLEAANVSYNMPGAYTFKGQLDEAALEAALLTLVERHESLRTIFRVDAAGQPRQVILPAGRCGFRLEKTDLRGEPQRLAGRLAAAFERAFDLAAGPLLRAGLYRVADEEWAFCYVMHHIVSDGWSMEVLIGEVLALYNAYRRGEPSPLPPLRIQYKDYAAWQGAQLRGEAFGARRRYWLDQLAGELPVLELPLDQPRPAVKTYRGDLVRGVLARRVTDGLRAACRQREATLFMGLLAGVNALLYRYTRQEDLIVGSPMANRNHADLKDQIGFYLDLLPLRTRFSGSDGFGALLDRVRQVTLGAYENQGYPFEALLGELRPERDGSRSPLFDVFIDYHDNQAPAAGYPAPDGLTVSGCAAAGELRISKYDLTFMFQDTGEGLHLLLEYNADLFARPAVERLFAHFEGLLAAALAAPTRPVRELDYLGDAEKGQLLRQFNVVPRPAAGYASVVARFDAQAAQTPAATALVFGDKRVTYRELAERSNQLAHHLRMEYGIRSDDLVGLMLDRSEHLVGALLGILKAGAAYVPIEPAYPPDRKDYILRDTGVRVLITQTDYLFDLASYAGELFAADVQLETLDTPTGPTGLVPRPTDAAYVIYTSGSTGRPKGCVLTHDNLAGYVGWADGHYFGGAAPHFGLFTALSFDLTVTSIFCPLLRGGSLYIYPQHQEITDILRHSFDPASGINSIKLTPSHVELLPHLDLKGTGVTCAIVGGEEMTGRQVGILKALSPALRVYNEYGPTEATVGCVVAELHENEPIVIGKPIAGAEIYVLDEGMALCPVGVTGELCIGGKGLARGYWNREELTREKFVENAFRPGERLYKTGDLGRWQADGNLVFAGRKDDQVKIRGHRIELGEVQQALLAASSVQQAVVVLHQDDQGHKQLVGYLVSETALDAVALRDTLKERLPAYMVPAHLVQLEALPLTANGKVDKKRLPLAQELLSTDASAYLPPVTEAQSVLVEVLQEVLKKRGVGLKDDFFVLGGDSIKSIQIVSRLKGRGYALSIQDILLEPLVEAMASKMSKVSRMIAQETVSGPVGLTPIQAHFFALNFADHHHFNQSVLLESGAALDVAALEASLQKLLLHHDALRLTYGRQEGGWQQVNRGAEQAIHLQVLPYGEDFVARCEALQQGMDLAHGPLLKAALFQAPDKDRLLLVAHHLVVDGVSWRILLEDLSTLYRQYRQGQPLQLPAKTDSYQYWQAQLSEYAHSEALQGEAAYWQAVEALPVPAFPVDFPEENNLVRDAATLAFELDEQTTTRLLTRCYGAYRTEVNDVLLTALALAVGEVFGLSHLPLGMEGHGRENIGREADVTRTVGWFTSLYPVVLPLQNDPLQQLVSVKEVLHRVPNKGIGYGVLRYLAGKPFALRTPVAFNYLGDFGSGVAGGQGGDLFAFSGEYYGRDIAGSTPRESLLDVSGMRVSGKLLLTISYGTRQYAETTVQRLLAGFENHLRGLIARLSGLDTPHLTPVDLTYRDLTVAQVQALNHAHDLEDVYPLAPLQEGLYYYWLSDPGSSIYFGQMSYRLGGQLNIDALEESYHMLVARHAALRTHFSADYGLPLQIVRKTVPSRFVYRDVSEQADFSTDAFKAQDRAQGFDLHAGSQMRLTVLKLADHTHELVWSHHHILMDGWCGSILIKEYFQLYHSLLENKPAGLPKVYPYADYVRWITGRPQAESLAYWRQYLAGFDTPKGLPAKAAPAEGYLARERELHLDAAQWTAIRTLCAGLGVTENTFLQAAWGILLSRYTGSSDVVFGAVVSGRPGQIEGIEEMIGLFINTIPVRVRFEADQSFADLLKAVQGQSVAGLPHHYTQLVEIQAQSRLTAELFDNILVFENYPVQEHEMFGSGAAGKDRPFHVLAYDDYVQSNYGFTLSATPGESLTLKFMYDGYRYADHDVEAVGEGLQQLIALVTADANRRIADVTGHLAQREQATQKERSQQFKMKNIGKLKSKIAS